MHSSSLIQLSLIILGVIAAIMGVQVLETFYQTRLPDWPAVVLSNLFPVLLILFSRQLSNYFASKMTEESTIEIKERSPNEL